MFTPRSLPQRLVILCAMTLTAAANADETVRIKVDVANSGRENTQTARNEFGRAA